MRISFPTPSRPLITQDLDMVKRVKIRGGGIFYDDVMAMVKLRGGAAWGPPRDHY
jgi:hypothetical protein